MIGADSIGAEVERRRGFEEVAVAIGSSSSLGLGDGLGDVVVGDRLGVSSSCSQGQSSR